MSEEKELIYDLNGETVTPTLHKLDIQEQMKKRAYDLAVESMQKFSVEKDIADNVKEKFDEEFLPSWQCIVGKDFAVSFSHESENFLFFAIDNMYFLLFKI
jgi:dynein light chain LC8-type